MIPQIALDFIKTKKLKTGFSYKDVWHEEHATAFTVAKAMQLDVLTDLHNSVISSIENGESFDTFRKNIKPLLQKKGWWGKKKMTDPLTGKEVNAQLGSDRRLKTIYRVNMRSAFQREQYKQTMESVMHPYLMYRIGASVNHRKEHVSWDGLILPKDDPWWNSHFPPNGWGCNCYTRAVSEARLKKYQEQGIRIPPAADGTGGGTLAVKTKAPPDNFKLYLNERKGTLEQVPEGIDPAFNWNVGSMKSGTVATQKLKDSKAKYEAAVKKEADARKRKPVTKKPKIPTDVFETRPGWSSGFQEKLNSIFAYNTPKKIEVKPAVAERLKELKFTSVDDFADAVNSFIKKNKTMSMFNLDETLQYWVKDPILKNQFETKTSHGLLSTSSRNIWESIIAGKKIDANYMDARERPYYGFVGKFNSNRSNNPAAQYGRSYIVYKDSVRKRATYTLGNSSARQGAFAADARSIFNKGRNIKDDRMNLALSRASSILKYQSDAYLETQIWGCADLTKDVEKIILHEKDIQHLRENTALWGKLKKMLDKAGVTVIDYDGKQL